MFADARDVEAGTELEADLCIVGAGAAGITLAREFIGGSVRVVLLESGGFDYEADTQALYEGRQKGGIEYFPLETARLRQFGGTTNHWGGLCRPFEEVDFQPRDWIPHSGWPIDKTELDPFYERARVVANLPSPLWSADEWVQRDHLSPLKLGRSFETRVAQDVPSAQKSFGVTYRDEIDRAPNVTAYHHANAVEVQIGESGAIATAIQVATLTGRHFSVAAKQFVLALGGLENPRLLLASDKQERAGVGNRNDLVGRFFLEHPRFIAGMIVPTNPNLSVGFYQNHRVGDATTVGYIALARDAQSEDELVDVQIRIEPAYEARFEQALDSVDVDSARALLGRGGDEELGGHIGNVVRDLMSWRSFMVAGTPLPVPYPELVGELIRSTPVERQSLIPGLLGDVAGAAYSELSGRAPLNGLALSTRFEPVPNPDSRVLLIGERDALNMRRIQLNWKLSDLDKHSVRRTLEILAADVGRTGLGRMRILFDGQGPWPQDLAGGWHLMGTTRMSDSAHQGVVDRNCRVHGMANLYVAGSSVFPTAGSGTPTLTLIALALRLAQHLKRSLS